ncbi:flagellar hook-associated protein FlgK [uncultured Bartonella sp.]|uniref:flagellar hook-associated protein FlgK n=1 Tax=uncultured Bartonella sp. TaxID=104108 RepID=UPI00260AB3ED|nr:flagellar hook-associated protein FlgK [uncultured Bartonella sp.]
MTLGSALSTARNSLKTSSGQLGVVSQNIGSARDTNYTHRTSHVLSGSYGTITSRVIRDDNPQLLNNYMIKSSHSAAASAYADGATRLSNIYNVNDYENSPTRLIDAFKKALQLYANTPSQRATGDAAIDRARDLVTAINSGSREIEKVRTDIDSDIKDSVDHINDLLKQFQEVEKAISDEIGLGRDGFAYMDRRDAILKDLSQEIGITTVTHPDGSMAIYGMDGSTLFDKVPRQITFSQSTALPAGTAGSQVLVDGVPLSHASFNSPYGSGKLGGLVKIRDEIAPQYQKQLDETAAALYDIFKGPPELFENGGDATVDGMAGRLSLNPLFDSKTAGGGPENLGKDLQKLVDSLSESRTFTSESGLGEEQSLISFAKQSQSWMEGIRSNGAKDAEYQNAMFGRAAETLSNETGVNTDDEMALMLQLEQTYSATARIISTVGRMLDDLMSAVK